MIRPFIALSLAMFLFAQNCAFAADAAPATGGMIENLNITRMTVSELARLLTESTTVQITVSRDASQVQVDAYLKRVELEDALRAICGANGLWYKRDSGTGIIQILTMEEFRKGVNVYSDETVEVLTIKYPAAEEVGDTLARLFQDRVVWNRPSRADNDPKQDINRALDRLDIIADRATMVTQSGSNSSNTGNGSTEDDSSESGSRSVQDASSIIETQSRTINALRATLENAVNPAAASSEVRLVEQSNRPGLVYISSSPTTNALVFRSNDPYSLAKVKKVAQDLDQPQPQVLLEVKVLNIDLNNEMARGIDWLFRGGPGDDRNRVTGGWSRGVANAQGQSIKPSSPAMGLVPQGTGLDPRAAVFSLVTEDIRARLQLLQDNNLLTSLATPNLLVANNEASRVFVGEEEVREQRVTRITNRDNEGDITDTVDEVENTYERIGTTLLITPRIHADRTVTIRILQEETTLGEKTPTANDGFIRPVGERSVVTTVVAKDRNTIAIGGLIREARGGGETGVPGLMKLPVIGGLFKKETRTKSRSELLVLIRPVILIAPGEADEASEQFLRKISRHPTAQPPHSDMGVEVPGIPLIDERKRPRADILVRPDAEPIRRQNP